MKYFNFPTYTYEGIDSLWGNKLKINQHRPAGFCLCKMNTQLDAQLNAARTAPVYIDSDPYQAQQNITQWAGNVSHAMARQQVLRSDESKDGEHGQRKFVFDNVPSDCPQIMLRRGVSPDRYIADVDALKELYVIKNKKENSELLLCFLTCGISSCFAEGADVAFKRQCKTKIREMNQYYNQFGISWSYDFIPFTGSFLNYEF